VKGICSVKRCIEKRVCPKEVVSAVKEFVEGLNVRPASSIYTNNDFTEQWLIYKLLPSDAVIAPTADTTA